MKEDVSDAISRVFMLGAPFAPRGLGLAHFVLKLDEKTFQLLGLPVACVVRAEPKEYGSIPLDAKTSEMVAQMRRLFWPGAQAGGEFPGISVSVKQFGRAKR